MRLSNEGRKLQTTINYAQEGTQRFISADITAAEPRSRGKDGEKGISYADTARRLYTSYFTHVGVSAKHRPKPRRRHRGGCETLTSDVMPLAPLGVSTSRALHTLWTVPCWYPGCTFRPGRWEPGLHGGEGGLARTADKSSEKQRVTMLSTFQAYVLSRSHNFSVCVRIV